MYNAYDVFVYNLMRSNSEIKSFIVSLPQTLQQIKKKDFNKKTRLFLIIIIRKNIL